MTLRDEVSGLLFPSKYPAALAAVKPVLLVGGHGAPFEWEIQSKGLGWTCPHQASAVMDAIRDALQNPEKRKAMGGNTRQVLRRAIRRQSPCSDRNKFSSRSWSEKELRVVG